jgi:hypothetical protein
VVGVVVVHILALQSGKYSGWSYGFPVLNKLMLFSFYPLQEATTLENYQGDNVVKGGEELRRGSRRKMPS